jgi:hypothetical protein
MTGLSMDRAWSYEAQQYTQVIALELVIQQIENEIERGGESVPG